MEGLSKKRERTQDTEKSVVIVRGRVAVEVYGCIGAINSDGKIE